MLNVAHVAGSIHIALLPEPWKNWLRFTCSSAGLLGCWVCSRATLGVEEGQLPCPEREVVGR